MGRFRSNDKHMPYEEINRAKQDDRGSTRELGMSAWIWGSDVEVPVLRQTSPSTHPPRFETKNVAAVIAARTLSSSTEVSPRERPSVGFANVKTRFNRPIFRREIPERTMNARLGARQCDCSC